MHPARKYSQNSCKNKSLNTHYNKQNRQSITQAFNKKHSIGNHVLSQDNDIFGQKKSITEQKISVCLDPSQNKTYAFERQNIKENQIKHLKMALENNNEPLINFFNKEINRDIYSKQMKQLLCTLLEKIEEDKNNQSLCSDENINLMNFQPTKTIMAPYLNRQLEMLEKDLESLRKRQQDLESFKKLNKAQKSYLLKTLRRLEQEQRKQIIQLQTSCLS